VHYQLNDPSLLKQQAIIGGKWLEAQSGKRFDIIGISTPEPLLESQPD